MASTWIISAVIWAPWILFWQFLTEEGRTVAADNCYIQFIWDSKVMAIVTAGGKSGNKNIISLRNFGNKATKQPSSILLSLSYQI